MRQAQINLEDSTWAALQQIADLRGVAVSDLIRAAVEEKYHQTTAAHVEAFRAWKAPWYNREDIGDSSEYLRQLREDARIDRLDSE